MLHERIRDKDEVAREPTAERDRNRSGKVSARAQSFLAPDQRPNERALEKEREHPFHRQCLANYSAGIFGKIRPVRSELKLHRNAGDDPDGKIKSENLGPKSNRLVVFIIAGAERAPFL